MFTSFDGHVRIASACGKTGHIHGIIFFGESPRGSTANRWVGIELGEFQFSEIEDIG
jgi:hypothetical protein